MFFCCACFRPTTKRIGSLGREGANCRWCNSTSRERAMLYYIHFEYFKKKIAHLNKKITIVGVSDGYLMETILGKIYRSRYKNYNYHKEPFLDITSVPKEMESLADILSCTEVLEHVAPPVENAFSGLSKLLRPGGKLIFSVPHSDESGVHIEHYPNLVNWKLRTDSIPTLSGETPEGKVVQFTDLVFHGGVGETLEYRVFSFSSLTQHFTKVGLQIQTLNSNLKLLGVVWEPWSRVWILRKPECN